MDETDREAFVRILHRVCRLYTVEVVAYQVLSNHFHLLVHAPEALPSEEEACQRFARFHKGKRRLLPGSPAVERWRHRMRDVSWFMRHLQHLYTCWYNRTRPIRRRGSLWAGRFKNTVLEDGEALQACWLYIECNPLRAKMVTDPADYRFGSCGAWAQRGRHPFESAVRTRLIPALPQPSRGISLSGLRGILREEVGRLTTEDRNGKTDSAAAPAAFSLGAGRRMRYWVDGLVIGSEIFVRDVMSRVRPMDIVTRHRLARSTDGPPLCCWRRLRVAVN
jgi:REP element-mobilizing transposase RayT